jgi:hypothetical protein
VFQVCIFVYDGVPFCSLSTAEIALEKHADVVRALLYLKSGLPTLLKVSFRDLYSQEDKWAMAHS